jgi:hypothetical protein
MEDPRLENVDIFYSHLEYFIDIWDILEPFGTFCVHLVHFVKKNLATLATRRFTGHFFVYVVFHFVFKLGDALSRVARCYICILKIPILAHFGGPWNG